MSEQRSTDYQAPWYAEAANNTYGGTPAQESAHGGTAPDKPMYDAFDDFAFDDGPITSDHLHAASDVEWAYCNVMDKYKGAEDSLSLRYRTRQFLRLCRRKGILDKQIIGLLPAMMAKGKPYNYCDILTVQNTDWRRVISLMADKFETSAIVSAREDRWYSLDLITVAREMVGQPLSAIVRAFGERVTLGVDCLDHRSPQQRQEALEDKLLREFEASAVTAPMVIEAAIYCRRSPYDSEAVINHVAGLALGVERHLITPHRCSIRCYICKTEGCRYSNHSREEMDQDAREWRARKNMTSTFEKGQYYADIFVFQNRCL